MNNVLVLYFLDCLFTTPIAEYGHTIRYVTQDEKDCTQHCLLANKLFKYKIKTFGNDSFLCFCSKQDAITSQITPGGNTPSCSHITEGCPLDYYESLRIDSGVKSLTFSRSPGEFIVDTAGSISISGKKRHQVQGKGYKSICNKVLPKHSLHENKGLSIADNCRLCHEIGV